MEITGKLKAKGETKQVSDKFKSREFVLTDNSNDKYPQHIALQLTQDKCSIIDNFAIGTEINVSINIRGREWTNPTTGEVKYFNTLDVWRIEGEKSQPAQQNEQPDDLPF